MGSIVGESSVVKIRNDEHQLTEDVASLIRVRHRFSGSPDIALPRILEGLIPRLVKRMETHFAESVGLGQHQSNEQLLRLRAQGEISGILAHALERIKGNTNIPLNGIVEALLPSVIQPECPVAWTWLFAFLGTGIARCKVESLPLDTMAVIIKCIDQIHNKAILEASECVQTQLSKCSWIFLDTVAIVAGLTPLIDWDIDHFKEPRWEVQKSSTWQSLARESAVAAVTSDGNGLFHLLLDVLLFVPDQRTANQHTGIASTGLSRMNHRKQNEQPWPDIAQRYLRHLKLACLRISVWPHESGLFQKHHDRALVLCILMNSFSTMHGRLATDYLHHEDGHRTVKKLRRSSDMAVASSPRCSTSVACALLILILGDAISRPVLEAVSTQQSDLTQLWERILGPLPKSDNFRRPPLPLAVASRAVAYLQRDHLEWSDCQEGGFGGKERTSRLLINLLLLLAEQHIDGKFWAIQLVVSFFGTFLIPKGGTAMIKVRGIEFDGWEQEILTKCLRISSQILYVVVEAGENVTEHIRAPQRVEPLPLGVPAPFDERNDLNRLLSCHRANQKRRNLAMDEAIHARRAAYQMITNLVSSSLMVELESTRSFKWPCLLLKCAVYEHRSMQPYVSKALDSLLQSYVVGFSDIFPQRKDPITRSSMEHEAVPLLPSLLDAVCSESAVASSAAIQWISQILRFMDPLASWYLTTYLVEDVDTNVALAAKHLMNEFQEFSDEGIMDSKVFRFLDRKDVEDMSSLDADIESRINTLSKQFSLSRDASRILLHDFSFSIEDCLQSLQEEFKSTIERCGLSAHLDVISNSEDHSGTVTDTICGICYEKIEDPFSGPCGHDFCSSCWQSFLLSTLDEGKQHIIGVRCPQHDCDERMTLEEIARLHPELGESWREAYMDAFVDIESRHRCCPGPDCTMVVESSSPSATAVSCTNCATSFCFQCGEIPHEPAQCQDFAKWIHKFGSSKFFIKRNTKVCCVRLYVGSAFQGSNFSNQNLFLHFLRKLARNLLLLSHVLVVKHQLKRIKDVII